MVYECEHCGYITNRQSNFLRHQNRKFSCKKTNNRNNNEINNEHDISLPNVTNMLPNVTNVTNMLPNVAKNQCKKCQIFFSNVTKLNNHILICKGVDSLTCHICLKKFDNRMQKYRHRKKGNCEPPPPPPTTQAPQQILSQTINNNTTNNITNIENQTNNNIQINVFGKEDLTYLLNDNNILQKLKYFGKSGIYGLPKILNDVHFNKDKPENNTLIKPDEYGNGVMILNDEKEWEYREFEDIRDNLIDTIIKYFKAYNVVKKKLDVKLIEKKERNIIKNFAYELMALEGTIPEDLFEELGMDEDELEEGEDELKNKLRKFDKSAMKNIHHKTTLNYRKDNGNYIKKK